MKQIFNEKMPYRGGPLYLDGKLYRQYLDDVLQPIVDTHGKIPKAKDGENFSLFLRNLEDNVGNGMKFYIRELPTTVTLEMMDRRRIIGSVRWDAPVDIPILGDKWNTWMSLTPNEIITQRGGIRRARGTVLVGGMGMGWFARRCLERSKVSHVTVVDKNQEVLDYFGTPLLKDHADRLTLVCEDAYKMKVGKYDSVLYDIWPGMGQSVDDYEWMALVEGHPNAWAW